MEEEKQNNIAKLLGLELWEDVDIDFTPVADLMDKYLSETTISKAALYMNGMDSEGIQKQLDSGLIREGRIVNYYAEFEAHSTVKDTVAKQFYEQNNYNFPFVKQMVETLNNIKNMYFHDVEIYSGKEVMAVIESELFDRDELFAYSDGIDLTEKVEIYEGIVASLKKSIDPAAVMMSMDAIMKPEDGDGAEFFRKKEQGAIKTLIDLKKGKNKIPDETMVNIFGADMKEIHPMASLLIKKNFTKENIAEFEENGSIKGMDTYYSNDFNRELDKVNAIVFRKLEQEYFSPKRFIKKNIKAIGNDTELKEAYENKYNFIKNKVIADVMKKRGVQRKDVQKIPGNTAVHFLTHMHTLKKKMNENDEVVSVKVGIVESLKDKLVRLKKKDEIKKENIDELVENGQIPIAAKIDINTKIAVIEDIINTFIKMKSKNMELFLPSSGVKFKNEEVRKHIIGKYSRDEQMIKSITDKSSKSEDVFITHEAHVAYLIKNAQYRELNKPMQEEAKDTVNKAYMTQEKMAEVAQKYRSKVIEFNYLNTSSGNGLFAKEETALMLPIEIFDTGKSKAGIPFESIEGKNIIVMAKEGAFVKVELDKKKKVVEGSVEVVNPNSNGKLPGYNLTWKGQNQISNFWNRSERLKDIKSIETKPKVKVNKAPAQKRA